MERLCNQFSTVQFYKDSFVVSLILHNIISPNSNSEVLGLFLASIHKIKYKGPNTFTVHCKVLQRYILVSLIFSKCHLVGSVWSPPDLRRSVQS